MKIRKKESDIMKTIKFISGLIAINLGIFAAYYVNSFHQNQWYTMPTVIAIAMFLAMAIFYLFYEFFIKEL